MTVTRERGPEPFGARDYAGRMARATADAAAAGLDGIVVGLGPDLAWLTGYHPTAITERLTLLVLRTDVPPVMLVPTLERPDAEAAAGAAALTMIDWRDGVDPYEAAGRLLPESGRFAVSDSLWALHLLGLQHVRPATHYQPITQALPMLRAIKDEHELERLAKAGAAADATYEQIIERPFAGRREIDIAADLADLLRDTGHQQVDFTIVGSGPNGADPHHEAGDRIIRPGDTVVLDFGGLLDGYGSDTTRTVTVGDPPAEVREVHAVVQRAQQAAFEAVHPGIACQEIDRVARRVITEAGYGEAFIHRTGHGIGVETHEPPYMVEGEEQLLQPGMCFSIEPGIYFAGRFGVRIEDIVTVTGSGGRRLNNTHRGLSVVH